MCRSATVTRPFCCPFFPSVRATPSQTAEESEQREEKRKGGRGPTRLQHVELAGPGEMGKASRPFTASKRRRADTARQAGMQMRTGQPIRDETTPPVPNCRVRALPDAEEAASRTLEGGKRTTRGVRRRCRCRMLLCWVLHTVRGIKEWEGAEAKPERRRKKSKGDAALCLTLLFSLRLRSS